MRTIIKLYDSSNWNSNSPPTQATEFVHWLTAMLEEVPSELQEDVDIEMETYEHTEEVTVTVSYAREETEAERVAREEAVLAEQKLREKREREQFEKLKAKFEP